MMELKITPFTTPKAISFNYEEIKAWLIEKAEQYATVVYSDDQVKMAKEDRANLNRLKKALNDERIRQEKEYMQPFATFKAQINEIIAIIDKPVQAIDAQVKAFEEQRQEEKFAQIEDFWNGCDLPAPIKLLQIMDTKWLNASVSMKSIQEAITGKLIQIATDLEIVRNLPAYAFEAEQAYLSTLDLGKAISKANELREMAERKAAYEAEQARLKAEYAERMEAAKMKPTPAPAADLPTEPQREWIAFQAFLTPDEARALGQYLKNNGIPYKAV